VTTNLVTVTANFGAGAEGHWLIAASGTLLDDSNLAIVQPVIVGAMAPGGTGLLSASLLASDNFGAGELFWNIFLQVRGQTDVNWQDFAVNFALGASQNLFTILRASGWTPLAT
jgi:hypothetical protein